jgi:hypothetical protein
MAALVEAMPQSLRRLLDDALTSRPCADVKNDYCRKFVEAERYAKCLAGFKALAEAAVAGMPSSELEDATPRVAPLAAAAVVAERLDKIANKRPFSNR